MQIWSAEIKELENLYRSLKDQFPDLAKEIERLIKTEDENVILVYSRRCLETIITDLCESELKRPRQTEPLKGIIDKLNREEKIPSHIVVSMQYINSYSTFGAHPKEFDPRQIKPVLYNLITIIEWYLKYKEAIATGTAKVEESEHIRASVISREGMHRPKKKLILSLSGLLLAGAVVIVVLYLFNVIGAKAHEKSIAVLPFENLSIDEDEAWFSNGITDVISNQLFKISEFITKSREWALKALEIDENLGESYFIIGLIRYVHEWDWNGANQAFKKGMEHSPNCVWGRRGYANFLTAMGRFKESISIGQQTLKLNPRDPNVYNELGFPMYFNGQDKKALELYNKSLALNPKFEETLGLLMLLYTKKGLYDKAISYWVTIMELNNNDIRKIPAIRLGFAGQMFGMAGRRDETMNLINELNRRAREGEYMPESSLALIYIGLGENEIALELLEKGFNHKDLSMPFLKVHTVFDPLRSKERFKELLKKMGFEED